MSSLSARRAWIEMLKIGLMLVVSLSLSARRAWIEMLISVLSMAQSQSLSARRAWIEIALGGSGGRGPPVALRKESVDRNQRIAKPFREQFSRSPQGERG